MKKVHLIPYAWLNSVHEDEFSGTRSEACKMLNVITFMCRFMCRKITFPMDKTLLLI